MGKTLKIYFRTIELLNSVFSIAKFWLSSETVDNCTHIFGCKIRYFQFLGDSKERPVPNLEKIPESN